MLELHQLKWLCAIIVILTTTASGFYPFKKRIKTNQGHDFPIGEALAAGVFLGAGLLHMLGDAASQFDAMHIDYPVPFLLAGITFLALLWLEHFGKELYHHQGGNSSAFAILSVIVLSFHSLLAGAALGLSGNISVVLVILIAIIAHKWAASFALAVQLNTSSLSLKACFIAFGIFALMTPAGILLGNHLTSHLQHYPLLTPIFLSLAAGTFLYLGTLHGLNRAVMVQRCCNLKHFSFVILGFAIMAIVAIWT